MKERDLIYSQRGEEMDEQDVRMGLGLWRVRMCSEEAQSMCKVGCNMGVTNVSK